MAVNTSPIGFEGFEKRLELTFSGPSRLGLRSLTRSQIDSILEPACCTIVSNLSNSEFDSYVLSESSLFIYPLRIILKTCGTTKLLLSIPPILQLAESLSLTVLAVKYSRGSFIFPGVQLAPHRSFSEEVSALNEFFGYLNPSAYLIGDPAVPNRNWHIYSAARTTPNSKSPFSHNLITVEMCMTGLHRDKARVFYKKSGDYSAEKMTKLSGIDKIIPTHQICDFEFDPCGYSMNGIDGPALSTVHVTPEDGFSYASYEAMGFDPGLVKFGSLVKKALNCFGPTEFTVAVTCRNGYQKWATESGDVEGYECERVVEQVLTGDGCMVYRTYKKKENVCLVRTPAKANLRCWKDDMCLPANQLLELYC